MFPESKADFNFRLEMISSAVSSQFLIVICKIFKVEIPKVYLYISTMIDRNELKVRIKEGLRRSPVVALLGPRQCGKTTLARTFLDPAHSAYFDLEDPVTAMNLEQPMSILSGLTGLVVIDEAQRQPELFPILRVLVDREKNAAQFLILGSASPDLSRQAAESLAGRVEVIEMGGFSLDEVGEERMRELWIRGTFPRSLLAEREEDSVVWRRQFVRSFLEQDLRQLGFGMSPSAMGRFWTMLAHVHGQVWNAEELATSLGVSGQTARNYLDALEQTFMVKRLLPWFSTIGKRLVKRPKVYVRDSGIFHSLLGVADEASLLTHPKLGASWEGFVIEQILRVLGDEPAYFHAVHSGAELDLYLPERGWGIEIKHADAPRRSRSMTVVMEDLKLQHLWVVVPGSRGYELGDHMQVVGLSTLLDVIHREKS